MKNRIVEYRTVGFEQEVRDKCIEILESSDLFSKDLHDCFVLENQGNVVTTSSGDVFVKILTIPMYCYSSQIFPSNKKTKNIVDEIVDATFSEARRKLWDDNEDELVELGIEDEYDDNLNYSYLCDMGRDDLAEELSEYEMDLEGGYIYTVVCCNILDTDDGIELTVEMTIEDEYGHVEVKDYSSITINIEENEKNLERIVYNAITSVTDEW